MGGPGPDVGRAVRRSTPDDDLTGLDAASRHLPPGDRCAMVLAGHHQPLRVWVLCFYFMGQRPTVLPANF